MNTIRKSLVKDILGLQGNTNLVVVIFQSMKTEKHTLYVDKDSLRVNNLKLDKIGVKTYKLD